MQILARAAFDSRVFWGAVAGVVVVKLILAALLPITGDEAYFVQYARNVDWGGFYDHPPMVGWMIWLVEHLASHPVVVRLPALLTGLVLGLGLYLMLRPFDEGKARLIGLLLLVSPVYLVNVLITTDTGLILFGFLSAVALQQALRRESAALYVVAGALLGLAFLSKYFAVLLGMAYLALLPVAGWRHWRGFLLLLLAALPFGLLNLAWNYLHCWNHVMFNVYNRNAGGEFSPFGVLAYVFMLAYLFALPGWYLLRDRRFIRAQISIHRLGAMLLSGLVPLAAFTAIALFADVGLHWLLLFVPLVHVACVFLSREDLERGLRFMGWFGGAHALVLAILLLLPVQVFDGRGLARDAVFYLEPARYAEATDRFAGDFHATDSYSRAAVLGFYTDRHWSVFGKGSRHARQDDTLTDWRARDGQRMVFISRRHEIDRDDLEPYFADIDIRRMRVAGQRFEVAIAEGFDFDAYHEGVLEPVRRRFYDIPDFLPLGGCPFLERYFDMPALSGTVAHDCRS